MLQYALFSEIVHVSISQINSELLIWAGTIDADEIRIMGNTLDIWVDEQQLEFLEKKGVDYQIVSRESDWLRSISDYRNYDETYSEIDDIANSNSSIVNMFSLGSSQGKLYYNEDYGNYDDFQHDVWCLKISDNPLQNEDEPNVFFAAEIHAREPISLEVDMYILNHIVDNYGTDPDITYWVDNTQIWFIPLMNPDGHKLVREYYSYDHRKNIRDNDGDGIADANNYDGVDLNRNFGYVWGPNGTSSTTSSSLYNGPYPWSEPEVVYVRDLLRSHKFWGGITYHSSGQYVLYPLGNLPGVCSYDHEIMDDLAVEMANTLPKYSSSGSHPQIGHYTPEQAVDFGYTCQGTMGDWGYSELRMFAFTLELSWTHIVTAEWIAQISEDNLDAALIFLDRAHHSTVTGNITDETRSPVVAEVYVQEIDFEPGMTSVEPVRSDSTFGRYYRLLEPGIYTLIFSLVGYEDITVENVIVNDSTQTELNVSFTSLQTPYVINPLTSISFSEDTIDNSIDLNTVFAIDDTLDLVYSYSNNSKISVHITDGLVELTPEADWNGEETIIFQATAQNGHYISEDLLVIITPVNDAPDIDLPDSISIIMNAVFEEDFSQYINDIEGDSFTMISPGSANITADITGLIVTITPDSNWVGEEDINFIVDDELRSTNSDSIRVIVYADFLTNPVVNSIYLVNESIRIEWEPVPGATEYIIYSSEDPNVGFEIDESGVFENNVWICPSNENKKFYRVIARSGQ